jgi:phosphopantothenoylcysteine synthetase/decarboxylase
MREKLVNTIVQALLGLIGDAVSEAVAGKEKPKAPSETGKQGKSSEKPQAGKTSKAATTTKPGTKTGAAADPKAIRQKIADLVMKIAEAGQRKVVETIFKKFKVKQAKDLDIKVCPEVAKLLEKEWKRIEAEQADDDEDEEDDDLDEDDDEDEDEDDDEDDEDEDDDLDDEDEDDDD